MAKKGLDVFARTGSEPGTPITQEMLNKGNVRPVGVGLRTGEIEVLDRIAAEYPTTRGGLIRLAIRLLIRDYIAGKLDPTDYMDDPEPAKRRIDPSKVKLD